MSNLLCCNVPLIDVNQEKDHELKQLKWFGIVSLALKYSRKQDVSTLLQILTEVIQNVDLEDAQSLDLLKTLK